MSADRYDSSRRTFLNEAGRMTLAAGAAAAAIHAAADEAGAQGPGGAPGKKIIAGSPSPAYSRAVRLDRTVYVAGCVGVDAKGVVASDFETQAEQTLLNLKESVERSGSRLQNVLQCTCFLKELQHFQTFNKVYMKFFPESPPARSTVVVKDFVVPGALLEVDCVCHV